MLEHIQIDLQISDESLFENIKFLDSNKYKEEENSQKSLLIKPKDVPKIFTPEKSSDNWEFIKFYFRKFLDEESKDHLDWGLDFLVYLKLGNIYSEYHTTHEKLSEKKLKLSQVYVVDLLN